MYQDSDHVYIVMDLCQGGELSSLSFAEQRLAITPSPSVQDITVDTLPAEASTASPTADNSSSTSSSATTPASPDTKHSERTRRVGPRSLVPVRTLSFLVRNPHVTVNPSVALPLQRVSKYVRQLLRAVRCLHKHNICHRDISLDNILLDAQLDSITLCSYSLSCFCEPQSTCDNVAPVGQLLYMAPEVFAGKPYDARAADVWSCGVVLFVMITGVFPFRAPSASDAAFAKVVNEGKLAELLAPYTVPPAAAELLQSIFQPEGKRATIEQLQANAWVQGTGLAASLSPKQAKKPSLAATASSQISPAALDSVSAFMKQLPTSSIHRDYYWQFDDEWVHSLDCARDLICNHTEYWNFFSKGFPSELLIALQQYAESTVADSKSQNDSVTPSVQTATLSTHISDAIQMLAKLHEKPLGPEIDQQIEELTRARVKTLQDMTDFVLPNRTDISFGLYYELKQLAQALSS
jgi:serine/threonine protein kinase